MNAFLDFLGNTPLGSALKVGLAASLVWVIDNVSSFQLDPIVQVFIVAALPAVINWLNPQDLRYGVVAEDAVTEYTFTPEA